MTVRGFLDLVSRNPYLVLVRVHGRDPERRFTVARLLDRTKIDLSLGEIESTSPTDMKRKLMGGWLEHWWTRDFV